MAHQFIEIFISQGGDSNHEINVALWFLPCLFVMEIFFDFIRRRVNNKNNIIIFLIICAIIGFFFSEYVYIRLPFSVDTMFVTIPFYGVGFIIAPNWKKINYFIDNNVKIMFIVFSLLSLGVYFFYGGSNFNNNRYSNYNLLYISAFIGIILITVVSNILIKSKLLLFLGRNTLILMCIHEPLKRVILIIISKITQTSMDILRGNIVLISVVTIVLILTMIPIIIVVNRKLIPKKNIYKLEK